MTAQSIRSPRDVDVHIGQRVRALRLGAGMTQEGLAGHLELTFQQVQKYENGVNRISAGRLYDIAGVLGVPIAAFFAGLAQGEGSGVDSIIDEITTRADFDLVRAAADLTPAQRRAFLNFVRCVSSKDSVATSGER
jgi:transcriptional regulator with XRE-family HTH domain